MAPRPPDFNLSAESAPVVAYAPSTLSLPSVLVISLARLVVGGEANRIPAVRSDTRAGVAECSPESSRERGGRWSESLWWELWSECIELTRSERTVLVSNRDTSGVLEK